MTCIALRGLLPWIAAAWTIGCGGTNAAPLEGTFVARPQASSLWLGFRVEAGRAAAFTCGKGDTLATQTRWMTANADGASVSFAKDGWKLDASRAGSGASGTLTDPKGTSIAFTADPVAAGGVSGLYTAIDSGCRAGAIVIANGSSVDTQGAWCDSVGNSAQVTPVMPLTLDAKGLAVVAETPSGAHKFFVAPVVPADITQ